MWIHLSRQGLLDNGQNVAEHSPVLFGFAGLYDNWKDLMAPAGRTIITTSANQAISPVHERMSVKSCQRAQSQFWLNVPSRIRKS
jgi:putative SOS response-associated peptidase YedK